MEHDAQIDENESPLIVSRPLSIIQNLPLEDRWEVTRRHPYYLIFWENARSLPDDAAEAEQMFQFGARLMLQQINVADVYAPPASRFEELGTDGIKSVWMEGAITRVQVRSLVATMIGILPNATKRAIIELLQRSVDVNTDDPQQQYELIRDVTQGSYPDFDAYFPDLLISLNPNAPQRAVSKAVEEVLRQYKADHNLPEQRRRDDKIGEYLRVWDLREGWTGSGYDCGTERKLKEIARELRISVQTAGNRYASAFKLIVGHEYRADCWARVVGIPKMSGMLGAEAPRLASRRPMHRRRPRELPETALSGSASAPTELQFLASAGVADDQFEQIDLMLDISTLISKGQSTQEIITELGLPDTADAQHVIAYFREGAKRESE